MSKILMTTVAALALSGSAFAQAKDYSTSTAFIPAPFASSWRGAPSLTTGFEDFAQGPINGQSGWTTFSANLNAPVVSDANPASGSQHLRITQGPGAASSFNGAFSPDLGPITGFVSSVVSFDINMDTDAGADGIVIGQAPSQALLAWRLRFDWQGNIFVLDDLGSGLQFVDTGVQYVQGEYRNMTVALDNVTNTIDYFYDGNPIYSSVAGVFAATGVEQVILAGDNFYNDEFESISYDNLSLLNVIPTPGSAALLGLAGLAAVRRRR